MKKEISQDNNKFIKGVLVGVAVAVIGFWGYGFLKNIGNPSAEEVEKIVVAAIKKEVNGLVDEKDISVKYKGIDYGMYSYDVVVGPQKVVSYATLDGKKLFASAINTEEKKAPVAEAPKEILKNDKPAVELFVMSHCPYGTQIEKGIIPVLETLGTNIDFELKFCDYVMHGEEELKEQMAQYCIQKEQKDKLLPYLKCFLKDGKSDDCLSLAGVDSGKLISCVNEADKQFKVMENFKGNVGYKDKFPGFTIFKEENDRYSITGSPALVINGVQAQSNRDSKSLLDVICSGFNNPPKECKTVLSNSAPQSGFGEGTGGDSSGSCN